MVKMLVLADNEHYKYKTYYYYISGHIFPQQPSVNQWSVLESPDFLEHPTHHLQNSAAGLQVRHRNLLGESQHQVQNTQLSTARVFDA